MLHDCMNQSYCDNIIATMRKETFAGDDQINFYCDNIIHLAIE